MNYLEKIFNVETNETQEVNYSKDQQAEIEANIKATLEAAKIRDNAVKATQSAKAALLEKLGITEEEAKLLLS